jgi:hypothetical protein
MFGNKRFVDPGVENRRVDERMRLELSGHFFDVIPVKIRSRSTVLLGTMTFDLRKDRSTARHAIKVILFPESFQDRSFNVPFELSNRQSSWDLGEQSTLSWKCVGDFT